MLRHVLTPDTKFYRANMGPIWVLPAPGGPLFGPMNLAILEILVYVSKIDTSPTSCRIMSCIDLRNHKTQTMSHHLRPRTPSRHRFMFVWTKNNMRALRQLWSVCLVKPDLTPVLHVLFTCQPTAVCFLDYNVLTTVAQWYISNITVT